MPSRSPAMSLKIRKEFLQKIKHQVRLYLGEEPPGLRRYALDYKRDIERSRWRLSSEAELFVKMRRARWILGGDFHAYSQAQRVHLRHLRELLPQGPVTLAVECVESRYQKYVDQFVSGSISEKQFLQKVNWEKSWGFPWSHYKPLFDLIKEHGARCLALNKKTATSFQGLKQRDRHAVQILKRAFQSAAPNEKFYVIYGDLHIAQKNIPTLLKKSLKPSEDVLTLYLNPEKIYFQLFHKNQEHRARVLRFRKDQFCLVESPPWVKWQSYLLFLEETLDLALESEVVDYSEHIETLLQILASDFDVKIEGGMSVASFLDHDFLDVLQEKLSKSTFSLVKRWIENDMSFFDPHTHRAYLARGTVNYAAHLAGLIFHALISGRKKLLRQFPEDFEKVIWQEAVAFFLSKAINPHRKSMSMSDLKKQLAAFSPEDHGERALKLALDQKMKELLQSYAPSNSSSRSLRSQKLTDMDYYNASKILGAMLGEKIHQQFKSGRLSRSVVLAWMKTDLDKDFFDKFYIQILRELDRLNPDE